MKKKRNKMMMTATTERHDRIIKKVLPRPRSFMEEPFKLNPSVMEANKRMRMPSIRPPCEFHHSESEQQ